MSCVLQSQQKSFKQYCDVIIISQKQNTMPSSQLYKTKYSKISLSKRQKLINLVQQQGKTIAMAARKLALKPSTAKLIVKKFRETGTFTVKKMPNYAKKDQRAELEQKKQQNSQNIALLDEKEELQKNIVQQVINEDVYEMAESLQAVSYQIVYFVPFW